MTKERLYFIDNIRILLTVLIILHHLAITYGAPGTWYYQEGQPGMISILFYAIFTGINQAFIMGFFFMISGYFTPSSYDRKGAWPFFKARLMRLGIPLLFYVIVIDPLIVYTRAAVIQGFTGTFYKFLGNYFGNYEGLGIGPLWFVETLLIFTGIYVLWRLNTKHVSQDYQIPKNFQIVLFALLLGIVTFVVRIWFPMGWNFVPLGLQFPFFPQYIGMFIIGMLVYRGSWFVHMPTKSGKLWLWIAVVTVLFLPVLIFLGAPGGDPARLRGGLYWQAFVFALWEQFLCVALVIALSILFRERRNSQGRLGKAMSTSAYAAYIFHAPIIVLLAFALRGIQLDLILKFVVIAPLAVFLCFFISNYIRKLPFVRKIL